ncbi:uncharacterized protein LOC108193143 isoform X2 [Daucus carota subsp. sativus]|uniref:uncharacterized protein LOC108193143 isoform X2 n=1 Tax=Daucus carota subsp. sativus TaxID=79200 RepID=UPI0007EF63E8|nr:PREDICTED: uncharacterized protein LOC108193143 isoform X2 [Daucus carota subsp. sativus]
MMYYRNYANHNKNPFEMANRFASILTGKSLSLSSTATSPSILIFNSISLPQFSNKLSKRVGLFNYNKRPRRVVLGLGVAFWAQFLNMAGHFGGKSFLASARQKSEVDKILENVEWPEQFPFKEEDFQRFDESPDTVFYDAPRFVTHIDDPAIAALTKYYSQVFPPSNTPGIAILDMCSSWVSHFPAGYKQERIAGMGLNDEELKRNPVSVDYLTKPLDVFKEMNRVLKPDGLAIMSFSNRCFWTKAISIWTSTSDADHVMIVGSYFHYAGGFEPPKAMDISPNPGRTDPMYIVYSKKLST